ncbi:DUF6017 domain-containing protein [Ruminococcus flavefaciens]|uniref:DUF6017 domain-containing protein n=1 Tax=Ruminococcus flavefaciens TaxID=1265 RepID=UPI0026F27BD3|nr:DUF6017 domain-containing protein [Ruminococcus flavefaciens]
MQIVLILMALICEFILKYELTDIFRLETVALESNIFKIPFSYIISQHISKYKTTNTMQTTASETVTSCNNCQDRTHTSVIHRSEKKKNFTMVDNRLLRSSNLSLKAIGLMVKVLSFPDSWKYSISGLSAICKEGKSAVKSTLDELKEWGYLKVIKLKPDQTQSGRIEYLYTFYEYSDKDTLKGNDIDGFNTSAQEMEPSNSNETYQNNCEQDTEKLSLDIQTAEIQFTENQGQINTENIILEKEKLYNQNSIHQSSAVNENAVEKVETTNDGMMEEYAKNQIEYTELVKNNIDFDSFADWLKSKVEAEEIVQIMVRQICSNNPTEVICKNEYSREVVKSTLLKADIEVLENAIEQINDIDCIRNREKYLVSTIFNEVNTKHFKENSIDRWAENAVARDFGDQIV